MDLLHAGSCHCGAVKWTVWAQKCPDTVRCNCSICTKKQNFHFIVPGSKFTLLQGSELLSEYRFNTKTARHLFCKICGVQSFYVPRSNPDGYGINPYCIDSGTIEIKIRDCDGKCWEESIMADEKIIQASKA